jgi:hypothetical protein
MLVPEAGLTCRSGIDIVHMHISQGIANFLVLLLLGGETIASPTYAAT